MEHKESEKVQTWHWVKELYDDGDVRVVLYCDDVGGVETSEMVRFSLISVIGVDVVWHDIRTSKDAPFSIDVPVTAEAYRAYITNMPISGMVTKFKERRAEFIRKYGIKNM